MTERWLTARPVAHRGLHDAANGAIENTASAFRAAIAGNYAIECDLQRSADGEAMVHHDDALGRLNEGSERLDTLTAAELQRVRFRATEDRILTLAELCALTAGRVPLVLELKANFDGDTRLAKRVAEVLAGYDGPAAVMSFDPGPVAALKHLAPARPRGLVAQRRDVDSDDVSASRSRYVRDALAARLQFFAYRVADLTAPLPLLARHVLGLPVLTWTVRTPADRARAGRYADQMIFEGFTP